MNTTQVNIILNIKELEFSNEYISKVTYPTHAVRTTLGL